MNHHRYLFACIIGAALATSIPAGAQWALSTPTLAPAVAYALAIGNAITSGTNGAVLYVGGGGLAQDASDFVWDATNNRLGIGTTSPGRKLSIVHDTNGDTGFSFRNNDTGNVAQAFLELENNVGTSYVIQGGSGISDANYAGYDNRIAIYSYASDGVSLIARSNGGTNDIAFYAGGSGVTAAHENNRRATVNSTGMGILTSSPDSPLEVYGQLHMSNPSATLPTCAADDDVGKIRVYTKSAGNVQSLCACIKTAAATYAVQSMTTGGDCT